MIHVASDQPEQTPPDETGQTDDPSGPIFHQRPWGYDRAQVDSFVERTARRIEEAEMARTPDGAVKRALDSLGAETSAVLQRAHEIADEITSRSRADADARTERAEEEAAAIRRAADERVAAADAELEALWQERQRLINDIDRIAEQLRTLITEADERYPDEQTEAVDDAPVEDDTGGAVVASTHGNAEAPTREHAPVDPHGTTG